MTTIILVAVGILIAAVAALMVIFFGGDAFSGSSNRATAATLINQGANMEDAVALYQAQEGKLPGISGTTGAQQTALAQQELLDNHYLDNIPPGVRSTWKVDYSMGIIRSTLGSADNGTFVDICHQARHQLSLPVAADNGTTIVHGGIHTCDDPAIDGREPCCIGTVS